MRGAGLAVPPGSAGADTEERWGDRGGMAGEGECGVSPRAGGRVGAGGRGMNEQSHLYSLQGYMAWRWEGYRVSAV